MCPSTEPPLSTQSAPSKPGYATTLEAEPGAHGAGDAGAPGERLPGLDARFAPIRRIGRGGMGEVYLAYDRQLGRRVAIKRIAARGASRRRVQREARLTARIDHPNVVTVHDVKVAGDQVFIISEYIEGQGLDRVGPLAPWTRVLGVGRDLARGLAAAHERGVLHRDIKPANAILDEHTGLVKLIDFGVAKQIAGAGRDGSCPPGAWPTSPPERIATSPPHSAGSATPPGARPGTPWYFAPEIWDGHPATTRSDVYSLGVVLYELCTGHRPPSVADPETRRPVRLERDNIDPRIAQVIHRCLELDPHKRYASGSELASALDALEAGPTPPQNPYRGLFAFQEPHRHVFFGRDAETREILEHLRTRSFVLMVGDSGVGKTSLVHAGVLPRVREGGLGGGRAWAPVVAEPGRRPLVALSQKLAEHAGVSPEDVCTRMGNGDFAAVVQLLRAGHGATAGALLFVDQLEELVTLSQPDQARRVAEFLAHLAEQRPDSVRILAAVRGDHLTEVAELPGLGALLQSSLYIVRSLGRDAIREAVIRPARTTGVRFESRELVDRLVDATHTARGGLPLLQFALAELWDARDVKTGVIPHHALEELGGVTGALARHADIVVRELAGQARRDAARRILVKLVTLHRTRARCTRSELVRDEPIGREVLEHLVKRRLLVGHEIDGEWVYSLAHEALLHGWPTLRGWLDRERELREIKERLAHAAREWNRLDRPRDALWAARRLREAERIDARDLSEVEAAFLAASRRALFRARWWKRGVAAAVLLFMAGSYGAVRYQAHRALAAKVDEHLGRAGRARDRAGADHQRFAALRSRALSEMAQGPERDWENPWQRTLELVPTIHRGYWRATQSLETALGLDPSRGDVRRLLAEVLDARARFAHALGHRDERDELLTRLAAIDSARSEPWRAPVPVSIRTEPTGGQIRIWRYVRRGDGRLHIARDGRVFRAPLDISLAPGSYVFIVEETPARVEVRYPLQVPSQAMRSPARPVTIPRPRTSAVPDGFVYIPAGRFLFGYGRAPEHEEFRVWHEAPPLHERRTGAYLISRYETTYRDWLEFVDACGRGDCPDIAAPAPGIDSSFDNLSLSVKRREHGDWEFLWRPGTRHSGYRAATGQPLVYEERHRRRGQNWLRFPVSGVSWNQVKGYLQWLRRVKGISGADLCTQEQWERAARGADDRIFPHGDTLAVDDANMDKTYGQKPGAFGPDEVGAHPQSASPFGVHDMTGNVWEMTKAAQGSPDRAEPEREERASAGSLVIRGGSFYHASITGRVFNRWVSMADQTMPFIGFRVCAHAPVD